MPRSRADRADAGVVDRDAVGLELLARDGGDVEVVAAARVVVREVRVDLLGDLVAAAARARAERGGDRAVAADLAQRGEALLDDSRRERAPAAVQRGDGAVGGEQDRQAVGDEDDRRGVGERCRLAVLFARRAARATAARWRGGPSRRGPGGRSRSAATDGRPPPPAGAGSRGCSPARPRSACRGSATRTAPRTRRRAPSRTAARACGRSATIWSPSQRNGSGRCTDDSLRRVSVYSDLLARRGAKALALACAVGWLAFAGNGLAIVLLVADRTGSFAAAGAAIAAFALGAGARAAARPAGRRARRAGARGLRRRARGRPPAAAGRAGRGRDGRRRRVRGRGRAAADRHRARGLAAGRRARADPPGARAERPARRRRRRARAGADRRAGGVAGPGGRARGARRGPARGVRDRRRPRRARERRAGRRRPVRRRAGQRGPADDPARRDRVWAWRSGRSTSRRRRSRRTRARRSSRRCRSRRSRPAASRARCGPAAARSPRTAGSCSATRCSR